MKTPSSPCEALVEMEWLLLTRCMLGSVVLIPRGRPVACCPRWATASSPLPSALHTEGMWRLEKASGGQAEPSLAVLWAPPFRLGLHAPIL